MNLTYRPLRGSALGEKVGDRFAGGESKISWNLKRE